MNDNLPLGVNPFLIDTIEELTPSKIESLSRFVFIHIKRDVKPTEIEKVSLKKILSFYYQELFKKEKKEIPSFPHFIHFIDKNIKSIYRSCEFSPSEFDFNEFNHLSSEFINGGIYSFLYDDSNNSNHVKDYRNYNCTWKNINFKNKSLIIFELDHIKDNPLLLSLYLEMIYDAIDENIWKDKTKKGIVLYDEFAKSLQFGNVLNQVTYYAQAIRKQNGALGIILQSINQLPNTYQTKAMIENIQVIYSLRNEKGYDDLIERLNLSKHQNDQLKSLQNHFSGTIKYSEFWLRLGNESNIYRLELPPEALLTYLSEGEENEKIMALLKKTEDLEKAIALYKKENMV